MESNNLIYDKVHTYYWDYDFNCATTMIKVLAEIFDIELYSQLIDSAIGMHGAGKYGAQCGLVEGSLMFIGIIMKQKRYDKEEIINNCYKFAFEFEKKFGSLSCKELRPEGFKSENPPHLCEDLTRRAVKFTVDFISKILNKVESKNI